MGNLPKKLVGKRVLVEFRDHSILYPDTEDALCRVCGIITKIDKEKVYFAVWESLSPDGTIDEENKESAQILQGTILRYAVIKEPKWSEV